MHATVIHAAVGRPAFGTSPGDGRVMATLRAPSDEEIEDFEGHLRRLAKAISSGVLMVFANMIFEGEAPSRRTSFISAAEATSKPAPSSTKVFMTEGLGFAFMA